MRDDILVVDFAFFNETKEVIEAFKRCRYKHTHAVGDGFFDHRVMWASAYPPEEEQTRAILKKLAHSATKFVKAFFDEPVLYCDGIQTVVWPEGVEMPPHQDDRHPDPNQPHNTPWRFIASVIYLNDDYEGGEIYFPHRDQVIKPRCGQLVAFPGEWWHGVHKVTSGQRYTCPSWYSHDPQHEDAFLE